jgi:WD40 repeat protein
MDSDKDILLWDGKTGRVVTIFPAKKGWGGPVAFSPDGQWAVFSEGIKPKNEWDKEKRYLVLWNLAKGRPERWFEGKWEGKGPVAFSSDSKRVVGHGYAKPFVDEKAKYKIRVWEVATGKELKAVPIVCAEKFAFNHGGNLAVGSGGWYW